MVYQPSLSQVGLVQDIGPGKNQCNQLQAKGKDFHVPLLLYTEVAVGTTSVEVLGFTAQVAYRSLLPCQCWGRGQVIDLQCPKQGCQNLNSSDLGVPVAVACHLNHRSSFPEQFSEVPPSHFLAIELLLCPARKREVIIRLLHPFLASAAYHHSLLDELSKSHDLDHLVLPTHIPVECNSLYAEAEEQIQSESSVGDWEKESSTSCSPCQFVREFRDLIFQPPHNEPFTAQLINVFFKPLVVEDH